MDTKLIKPLIFIGIAVALVMLLNKPKNVKTQQNSDPVGGRKIVQLKDLPSDAKISNQGIKPDPNYTMYMTPSGEIFWVFNGRSPMKQ